MHAQHQQVGLDGLNLAEHSINRRADQHVHAARHGRAELCEPRFELPLRMADRVGLDSRDRVAQGIRHVGDDEVFDDVNDVKVCLVP